MNYLLLVHRHHIGILPPGMERDNENNIKKRSRTSFDQDSNYHRSNRRHHSPRERDYSPSPNRRRSSRSPKKSPRSKDRSPSPKRRKSSRSPTIHSSNEPRNSRNVDEKLRKEEKRKEKKERKKRKKEKKKEKKEKKKLKKMASEYLRQKEAEEKNQYASATQPKEIIPIGFEPEEKITSENYFSHNKEFRSWLKQAKQLSWDDLTNDQAKQFFTDFVQLWNTGNLSSIYLSYNFHNLIQFKIVQFHPWY